MSAPTPRQDASLSAASFLASISAESSTSFESSLSSSSAKSAPALPISAKVSLIDAQIGALEGRIEKTITAHAAQLRQRAASTRAVDNDLNQLWRSINQISSLLVTVGPQLAPTASNYHNALAQSSKQGLLISVLSDLLAATRHLEKLEQLQHQGDLSSLKAELPKVAEVMQAFHSKPVLESLPAIVELRARFERLENQSKEADLSPQSVGAQSVAQQAVARSSLDGDAKGRKDTTTTVGVNPPLSPALEVLKKARSLITAKGSQGGWKEVRIELSAPVPPPLFATNAAMPATQSSVDSKRSSLESRAERLLRDDFMPESASLTRNSSSSSTANARNRHKPKLGARVIRPQDQLGSGPFNAEETPLDEDGWGLDEDDEDPLQSQQIVSNHHVVHQSQAVPHASHPSHPSSAAQAQDSRHSLPSSSVAMQSSVSSSSTLTSAFAIQEPEPRAIEAWGLADEDDDVGAEDNAWVLDDDDAPEQPPQSPKKARLSAPVAVESTRAHAPPSSAAAQDLWSLEDDDVEADGDPWEVEVSREGDPVSHTAQQLRVGRAASESVTEPLSVQAVPVPAPEGADDPWEAHREPERVPVAFATRLHDASFSAVSPAQRDTPMTSQEPVGTAEPSVPNIAPALPSDATDDPWETPKQFEGTDANTGAAVVHAAAPSAALEHDAKVSGPSLAVCSPHPDLVEPPEAGNARQHGQTSISSSQVHGVTPSSAQSVPDAAPKYANSAPSHTVLVPEPIVDDDPWEAEDELEDATAPIAESQRNTSDSPSSLAVPEVVLTSAPVLAASADSPVPLSKQKGDLHRNKRLTFTADSGKVAPHHLSSEQDSSNQLRYVEETSHHTGITQEATQPAVDEAEELEEDAWAFDEGSSASEADRAEFAPITPLSQTRVLENPNESPGRVEPAHVEPSKAETAKPSAGTVETLRSIPKNIATANAVHQPEPVASPPSSTGWGEDFSDSESMGIPAPVETHRNQPSVTSSRSVSMDSKAHSGTPTNKPAKLSKPVPEPPALSKEECSISQRSFDLVNLASSSMNKVISLLRGETHSDASIDDVEALSGTVFKIFELHRALMPVAHGEALRDVPSLAMQFFNDCEYLARELNRLITCQGGTITTTWLSSGDADGAKRWESKELPKLEEEAALTRDLGQRWFEAQMTAQTKILLDTLMEADGFARTFDDQRFARCEKCIKQVVSTLQQLAKAWKSVLVASRFHAAIGRLVDLVFQKVLHDVLDLEDIGESESEKLAGLVRTLGSLENLFEVEGDRERSTAPLWVPAWFKTSYLVEILTGSLVDIEFLAFEAGALVDYSRKELTGLIKALFADTHNRAKLLRRIEGAGADVLAH
ncbi:uncharacterized protein MEPE_06162 [Melanopsichium pennsylvanicum]|uniref:Retrograde transport protein Dsl1 C-terminal domain-containing protein n=2 Tax=Melanopsichium pennsylvanicum TaxID=63383 RepID=A0AAJ5C7Z2_9BASI|nr:conserved hypothetical protein [Melanopsichium pennsylvanicum 4]SNX87452.1 uncharacterized protein MEPE_06162 [Melanopsichium pennsylvanicum]